MKTKDMVFIALFAAVICVLAPFSVPVGLVPISLSTFAIYLTASILKTRDATIATALYILIGAVGVPVFAGFSGGFQKIVGVTGGYIVGYIPCAFLTAFIIAKCGAKRWSFPVAMLVGTAVLYAFGTSWFMTATQNSLAASLGMCVVPFLLGDAIKIAVASIIAPTLRKRLSA